MHYARPYADDDVAASGKMIPHSKPDIGEAEVAALTRVALTGMLVDGPNSVSFVENLSKLAQGRHVSLCSSGRHALATALSSLKLRRGSGIILQTYVCDAVVWAICKNDLTPQFADIGDHWCMTPDTAKRAKTRQTGAIILSPPFGIFQSAKQFRDLNLPIIHDLCQASLATIADAQPEHSGDVTVTSFHPTKYICAAGGGAIIKAYPESDSASKINSEHCGTPALFSELQAALGEVQLSRLPEFARKRSALYESYLAAAPEATTADIRAAIDVDPGRLFRFPIRTRNKLRETMASFHSSGVAARSGVDSLAHRAFGLHDDLFPNAVCALKTTMSVPFYPALLPEQASRVAETLMRFACP
ncbi:DegT/DnrJ/EryC1/StrS family aminotransferase [Methylobacterium sp. J-070]|uniref:DegT/DnrJ/EryC1/StrS family aminotransferase n=1 Tax=Methylobacterium sp. J-070 TaxID=2836650 RepID=UPI001FBA6838|nr:DegT/DnrJ/EryC1/StrS family aminotransferase [Methylobacterium sp. J-070]MCJ2054923.1 DegT/DnrJ/EryC1/StrS family aminotransferase [Methylobacterium sp. J-070]